MPSLTSRFVFVSMFPYLLRLPTEGSLVAVSSDILFVLSLYLSLLASCMGRGNSNSCFSHVIGPWLRVQCNLVILCIGIGLHGWDTGFIFKWATCVLSIDFLLSIHETCIVLFIYLDVSLCSKNVAGTLELA